MGEQNLKTGSIIIGTSEILPFIQHVGVILVNSPNNILVYHNSPTKTNPFGGSVIAEPLKEWIAVRSVIEVKETMLSKAEIEQGYENMKYLKFNLLNFNCEHFVTGLVYHEPSSKQLQFWGIIGALFLLNTN
ncbi:hypothetical protein [Dyadobacter sp. LHD-138]|uniref:hypothetical protein n=1 Tax=Dyadobacter sp. LHD-138 TaxID=3071413 RepID=UPI0027DFC5AF|nr:hypothetical protein [Dyadobacter sp. LHD-138]MDQ6482347.1 hypothetical protein [Dyadobacter sp. LHD-138]